jgi:hypothetical protein
VKLTLSGRRFKLELEIPRSPDPEDDEPTSPRDDDTPPSHAAAPFWDALDPTEREALRSVASWRTFAAGARLMEEGERADHVMVILGGQAKVVIDENGAERVLAVRGLGQLVGERAALQVSVRSATVIALDMVWALVVRTKDFAAFLSAHRRVLDIVLSQQYQRGTEGPPGHEGDRDPAGGPPITATADQRTDGYVAGRARRRSRPLNGENCTVLLTDVVEFGARRRTDGDRILIREALFRMTQAVTQRMPGAQSEDRGDGFLTVVPPDVSTARVLGQLLKELPAALELHNSTQRESARFKLRLAVNVGPVVSDMGVTGEAIIVAARLIEAPRFKAAIAESTASLGVIASPFVYETVIRHRADPREVATYSQVPVEVKESDTAAWMKLFGAPAFPPLIPDSPVAESSFGPLTAHQQPVQPGQRLPEVGFGGGVVRFGQREPAQRGAVVLGAGGVEGLGGHEEAEVGVLVRRFPLARGNVDDHHVPELGVGPRHQVGQAGLLPRFAQGDGQRVALPGIAVAANLEPGPLALVPAQQHAACRRVDDQRGGGDVQRKVAPPRVADGLGQGSHPEHVGGLRVAIRLVAVQERGKGRHSRRWY